MSRTKFIINVVYNNKISDTREKNNNKRLFIDIIYENIFLIPLNEIYKYRVEKYSGNKKINFQYLVHIWKSKLGRVFGELCSNMH